MDHSSGGPAQSVELHENDVIRVLLQQHARIRELFADVKASTGQHKEHAFDELRALLAVHETAEEMVLRPVSSETAGEQVADARNREEKAATKLLAKLEDLDCASDEFDKLLATLEIAVLQHAQSEEAEEFPTILASCDDEQRQKLGRQVLTTEKLAPTHAHPSTAGSPTAQWLVGPFASIVDRTRDALTGK